MPKLNITISLIWEEKQDDTVSNLDFSKLHIVGNVGKGLLKISDGENQVPIMECQTLVVETVDEEGIVSTYN